MITRRRKLEELLWVLGLHSAARKFYHATPAGRRAQSVRARMLAFYARLVPDGALIFDIGANLGGFAAVFAEHARLVVAVEPNGDCLRHIQLAYPGLPIESLQAVAGPVPGLTSIYLSDLRDDVSSVSRRWVEEIQCQYPEGTRLVSRKRVVPMVTLDTLRREYGAPDFIKIDVEGFESGVLEGLSLQPPLLSFEFNLHHLDLAEECVNKRVFDPNAGFNFAMTDPTRFELPEWVSRAELLRALTALPCRLGNDYGDIFVNATGVGPLRKIEREAENCRT